MKKYLLMAVAAIAAFSSCNNDNDFIIGDESGKQVGVFTATMEGAATRVTLDDHTPAWEAGDVISINGVSYAAEAAGSSTTFNAVSDPATGDTYQAYFPASLAGGTLPATQTYEAGKFNMPMYAESTTTDLQFHNLCAVLAIKVTSADIATVRKIKVKSDVKLNGSFTISENKAVVGDDGTNEVVLNCGTGVSLNEEGTTFYIYIPAQEYGYLNIYLSADGTTYKEAMATRKKSGLGEIARNKIFSIDYVKNATQLWANGPYFAKYNVGVTDGKETSRGGNYGWGRWTNKDPNNGWNYNIYNDNPLPSDSDTATKLWGTNWRMPQNTELQNLIDKCDCSFNDVAIDVVRTSMGTGYFAAGIRFVGKDSYAGNNIYLPAIGYTYSQSESKTYYYWASNHPRNNSRNAYALQLTAQTRNETNPLVPGMVDILRDKGCVVRAVLAE